MKVYIVEDYELMRMILKRLLRRNVPTITAFGESDTAEDAMLRIPAFNPDIVLVDISLPGIDGIEMIRRLKPQFRKMKFIVVTAHEVEIYAQAATEAGADGIISKNDDGLVQKISGMLTSDFQAGH